MQKLNRRDLLVSLGSSGILALAGSYGGKTRPVFAQATCTLTPQQTEGPYWFDARQVRRDITEGKTGRSIAPLAASRERQHLSSNSQCARRDLALRCRRNLLGIFRTGHGRSNILARHSDKRCRWHCRIPNHLSWLVSRSDDAHPFQGAFWKSNSGDRPTLLPRVPQQHDLHHHVAIQFERH